MPRLELAGQRSGRIKVGIEVLRHQSAKSSHTLLVASASLEGFSCRRSLQRVVRQFHHMIEISFLLIPPDLQDMDLAFMGTRDRLELSQSLKFTVVRALGVKSCA